MFDKSDSLFPVKKNYIYLSHCAIGPMYAPAAESAKRFIDTHSECGRVLIQHYQYVLAAFREKAAQLLKTAPDNVAYVSNTAEGINLIANGYPFKPGDQVISYVHEYPSNHYPWVLQKKRGVELILLSDTDPFGGLLAHGPRAWSMEELERKTTDRTRIVALSHVQFANGYAANLEELGTYCRDRGIDLIVDAAQSLGVLPLNPEEVGISAVAASTWKWLLGPRGAGLLYTSPQLREKLDHIMVGPAMMNNKFDYLSHVWDPLEDARRFEYSTLPWEHLVAIDKVLEEVFLRYPIEAIRDEIFKLQDNLLALIDTDRFKPLLFPREHRSGILAVQTRGDPVTVVSALEGQGIIVTAPGGYLRLAPHFYLTEEDVAKAAGILNTLR